MDLQSVGPERLEPGDHIRVQNNWMRIVKITYKDDWYILEGELEEKFNIYGHAGLTFDVRRRR